MSSQLSPASPKILALAGSLRKDSFNKKLVRIAADAARAAGADVTLIDLADYPLPIYDGDLESTHGLPENAKKLKQVFKDHQGLIISSPEYNSSITAVLKNTIDWVSRPVPGEPDLAPFMGKIAAIMSASPGALGGLRGLVHLRAILGNIKVIVIPEQIAINTAHQAFDDQGNLKDPKQAAQVKSIAERLVHVVGKVHT